MNPIPQDKQHELQETLREYAQRDVPTADIWPALRVRLNASQAKTPSESLLVPAVPKRSFITRNRIGFGLAGLVISLLIIAIPIYLRLTQSSEGVFRVLYPNYSQLVPEGKARLITLLETHATQQTGEASGTRYDGMQTTLIRNQEIWLARKPPSEGDYLNLLFIYTRLETKNYPKTPAIWVTQDGIYDYEPSAHNQVFQYPFDFDYVSLYLPPLNSLSQLRDLPGSHISGEGTVDEKPVTYIKGTLTKRINAPEFELWHPLPYPDTTPGETTTVEYTIAVTKDTSEILSADFTTRYLDGPRKGTIDVMGLTVSSDELVDLTPEIQEHMSFKLPAGSKLADACSPTASLSGENPQLYVADYDGTGARRLTNDPTTQYSNPSWSPDSKSLVFVEGISTLYTINMTSTARTPTLLESYFPDIHGIDLSDPEWYKMSLPHSSTRAAPGDEFLAVSGQAGQADIFHLMTHPEFAQPVHNLTNNAANDIQPATSPEGTRIVFVSNRDGNNEIYAMDADGSNQTRLTNNPASDTLPSWSQLGTYIAFTSNRDGNQEIYIMKPDGTDQTRLTNNPADDWAPAWQWLSDDTYPIESDYYGYASASASAYPGPPTITFISNRDGAPSLYTIFPNPTEMAKKLPISANIEVGPSPPSWSPDGKHLAFVGTCR